MTDTNESIRFEGPILAVDDDEAYRKELKGILDRNNLPNVFLESATHALRFLQNQPWNWKPGLIITDIVMDGMGGYQLMRRIQDLYPNRNIPILVISRLSGGLDVGEAEVAGASAYLTKPLDEKRLLNVLERISTNDKKGMLVFTHNSGTESAR